MERQYFSGNTVEQAVLAAARHYGLDPDRVAYTLRDKKHGFLNMRRRVVIEVDPAAPERPEGMAGPAEEESPWPERPPGLVPAKRDRGLQDRPATRPRMSWHGSAPLAEGDVPDQEAIGRALEEILSLLDLELEVSIRREEGSFEIELSGEDDGILQAREGALLDAVEHLLPRMVRGLAGHPVPCRLDCGGFREAHRREMRDLAERVAEEVRREMQSQVLEPMNPADRRLVHIALSEDPTVRTESEGGGFLKRVRISPA